VLNLDAISPRLNGSCGSSVFSRHAEVDLDGIERDLTGFTSAPLRTNFNKENRLRARRG
jgi:hypothetical protein